MNNPTQQSSPALRIEALSINCLNREVSCYAGNCNLLTVAESLTVHNVEYLFLLRLIILIHLVHRNAQNSTAPNTGMPSNPNTATGIIGNNPSNGGSRPTTGGGSGYNGGGGYTGGSDGRESTENTKVRVFYQG